MRMEALWLSPVAGLQVAPSGPVRVWHACSPMASTIDDKEPSRPANIVSPSAKCLSRSAGRSRPSSALKRGVQRVLNRRLQIELAALGQGRIGQRVTQSLACRRCRSRVLIDGIARRRGVSNLYDLAAGCSKQTEATFDLSVGQGKPAKTCHDQCESVGIPHVAMQRHALSETPRSEERR